MDRGDDRDDRRLTLATPDLAADVHYTALRVARERDLLPVQAPAVRSGEYRGGSGDVARALADGRADIGVGLTDSLVIGRVQGAAYRLVSTFVASPLTWRVLVSVTARARDVTDLRGTTFGITRAGGGAHTTLLLLAADMGWRAGVDVAVTPLGSLDALLRATGNGAIDAFLWEALTIKPWLDDGTIRSIGVVVPPWPGFSVAARTETTTRRPDAVRAVLHVLRHAAAIAAAEPDETAALITQRYGLSPRDAADWLAQVRYADDGALSRRAIETMVAVLRRTGAIVDAAPVEDIVDRQFAPLLD